MTTSTRAAHAARCQVIGTEAELAAHFAIREAVFVTEQGIFTTSDQDAHDEAPTTVHVLGFVDDVPAGTVRLFPLDPDEHGLASNGYWQGDRLAVLPEFRSSGLGGPLVRFAVATAGARGGRTMVAHIQPANRTFFRRLGWVQRGGPELYVGRPHLLMEISLEPPASP